MIWKKERQSAGTSSPVYMDGKLYFFYLGAKLFSLKKGLFPATLNINEIDIKTGKVIKRYPVAEISNYKYIRMIGYKSKCYISVVWRDEGFDK
ncbi:MAG: hypothetical protein ABII74_05730, partial [Elusimicrobiota bacterium]